MYKRILASAVALVVLFAASGTAAAQSAGDGLSISPLRTELTINPGETKTTTVSVTNVTDKPTTLKAILNDFGAADDETGTPKVYLDENSSAPSHGLKSYIQHIDNISLQPKERRDVKVAISMPKNAAGGGYYGLVRFAPASSSADKNSQVSLSGSVGSLLLVTVPGDIIEKASLESFNVARMNGDDLGRASNFFTNGRKDEKGRGLQAVVRIKNSGNVQVAPFGKVILKKGGTQIALYELNNSDPKQNVLPDSTRRMQVEMGDKASAFGHYTLEGNFGYGSKGQLLSASTSFWVVPMPYVIAGIVLLAIILGAILIVPRMLRSHDRKLLRRIRSRGKR